MVALKGTFRTLNEEWRTEVLEMMEKISTQIASEMGGKVDVDLRKGYPYLENDVDLTLRAKQYAIDLLGPENVLDLDLRMGGEDFSYYTQIMPGCFFRLGTSTPGNPSSGLHTPTFTVDESALKVGMSVLSWIALQELNRT
jgi:metal-dependent amidase/aminoacylase/carboxypeptidase family protein